MSSNVRSKLFGIVPYVDPRSFSIQRDNDNRRQVYSLDKTSDVYSVGVLLWEISSGRPPFNKEPYDIGLAVGILQGTRETTIHGTPIDYSKLYKGNYNHSWRSGLLN